MRHLRTVFLVAALADPAAASAIGIHPSSAKFEATGTLVKSEKIGGVTDNWTSTFTTNGGSGPYFKCETTRFTGTTQAGTTAEVTVKPSCADCFSNYGDSLVSAIVSTPKNGICAPRPSTGRKERSQEPCSSQDP